MVSVYPVVGQGAHALKLMNAMLEPDEGDAVCDWCGESFDPIHPSDRLCMECHKAEARRIAAAAAEQPTTIAAGA